MESQNWSFFSLVLLLFLSGLVIVSSSNPTNHVNGHDTVDSSGPMLQPGVPIATPPPARVTSTKPRNTVSPTTTPSKTATTRNSTATPVSVTRRLTPTVGNSSRTVSATPGNVNASGTPVNVTRTVSSTDNVTVVTTGPFGQGTTENSTALVLVTDNSTVVTTDLLSTIPGSPVLPTGTSNDSTTSSAPTGDSTQVTTLNSTIILGTTLVDGTDVPASLASTDNGTLMATTVLDQGTTVEVNTSPAELHSTSTSSNRTTRAAATMTPLPTGTTAPTTGPRTTDHSTSPNLQTTTDIPSTTSYGPVQTSALPTPLTTRPTLTPTTTQHGIPNKNKTTPTPPPVATTQRKTSPSLTTPSHWPLPTTKQHTTHGTTLMTSVPDRLPTTRKTTERQRPIRTTLHLEPTPTTVPPAFNSSYKLPTYLQLRLKTTWTRFCPGRSDVQEALLAYARRVLGLSTQDKLVTPYLNVQDYCRDVKVNRLKRNTEQQTMIPVDFFVGIAGAYYENLTKKVGTELLLDYSTLQEDIKYEIISTHILAISKPTTPPPTGSESQGAVIGSTLSVCALVFGVVLALVGMRVYRVRKAHAGLSDRYYFDGKQLQDALSESHQRAGATSPHGRGAGGRSHPAPTYREYIQASFNKGLVLDDDETMVELDAVEALPSHTLTSSALAKFYSYREAITEEFESLPGHQLLIPDAKKKIGVPLSSKLRSPVAHSPERTKVPIPPPSPTSPASPSKGTDFILDASFIRGYGSNHCRYIGAKVSGVDSSTAFWRTIWEQQTRTIVCLCSPYELGKVCPQYWPTKEGGPGTQLYGNILVTLKGGASGEHYFTSSLIIRNVEKSLCRPVTHYWFTNWLDGDVPSSPQALMSMLLQVHNTHQESYGPVIVHCSDGVGRTGLVIATDINMQRLEENHTIDIPHTVSSIRLDRGQAILNVEQYAFIYKTLYEFSKFLSSSATKETSDTESVAHENLDDNVSDTANDDGSSQGTNSSRASSYLGDLSASVKRTLALKFPSLGLSIPSIQLSPPSNRVSTGNFVVFNSPQATNLDMSVVSGISESDNGERNSIASSLQSPFDQTSFSNQNDVFSISHNDSTRLVPKGSNRHFSIGQKPSKKESSRITPRPLSTFCRGSKAMSSYEASKDYEAWNPECGQPGQSNLQQSLSSPKTDLRVQELPSSSRKRSRTNESLASTNPFKSEEPHQEFKAAQAPIQVAAPATVPNHVRQISYPVDMNPFGAPSPALPRADAPFTPFPVTSPVSPSPLFDMSDNQPVQRPNSNPFPREPSTSSFENSYPKEINPFEDASDAGDVFEQSSEPCISSNNAYVYVPRPDSEEHFIRQGTYPKGMNPFSESGNHHQVPPPLSQRAGGRNVVQLAPVPNRQNNGPPQEEFGNFYGMNPFDFDWMDSAEESFT